MKATACILFLASLALCGCSGDKGGGPADTEDTPVASAGIGTSGGTLEADGFALTVPAGAFADSVTLFLYTPDVEVPFGGLAVTPVYRIAGLPDDFEKPLAFRLRANTTIEDSAAVAILCDMDPCCGGDEDALYDIRLARDSLGFVVFELPTPVEPPYLAMSSGESRRLEDTRLVEIAGVGTYRLHSSVHFNIAYPTYAGSYIDDIGTFFDAAYDRFQAMEFDYTGLYRRFTSRIGVVLTDKAKADDFFVGIGYPRWGDAMFVINARRLSAGSAEELQCRIAGMFFVAVGVSYDTWLMTTRDFSNLWFHHAVGHWAQELFVTREDFIPYGFDGREMAPFNGIQAGGGDSEKDRIQHGIGMASLIKYATNVCGDTLVLNLYKSLLTGQLAVDRMHSVVTATQSCSYADFYRDYLVHEGTGYVYDVPSEVFLQHKAGTFSTATDSARTFPGSYPPLSAKIYFVDLNDAGIDSSVTIKFSAECPGLTGDEIQVSVFQLQGSDLHLLDSGNPCVISDIRAKTAAGYDLAAVAVVSAYNPSTTKRYDVALTVREEAGMPYKYFSFSIEDLRVLLKLAGGSQEWATWSYDMDGEGSGAGGRFTAAEDYWTTDNPPTHYKSSAEFVFNTETYAMTEFTLTDSIINPTTGVSEGTTIEGGNLVPSLRISDPYPVLRYDVTGLSVCSGVTTYEYLGIHPPARTEMLQHECTSETTLEIVFWNW